MDNATLRVTEVARDNLVLVVAPDHAWTKKPRLRAKDLAEGEWVLREPGSGTRVVFEEALQKVGRAAILPERRAGTADQRGRARRRRGRHGRDGPLGNPPRSPRSRTVLLEQLAFEMPARAFNIIAHCERQQTHAADALIIMMKNHREHRRPARRISG